MVTSVDHRIIRKMNLGCWDFDEQCPFAQAS